MKKERKMRNIDVNEGKKEGKEGVEGKEHKKLVILKKKLEQE